VLKMIKIATIPAHNRLFAYLYMIFASFLIIIPQTFPEQTEI